MNVIVRLLARLALLAGLVLVPVAAGAQQPPAAVATPPATAAPAARPAEAGAAQLQIGSVIQLKSGGPKMTVIGVSDGAVRAQWYNENTHVFAMADFPQAAVKVASDDDDEDDDEEDDEDED